MTTPIEEANIITTIAEYSETEKGLALLRDRLKGAKYDVVTTAGMALACKDRREVVSLRTSLEAKRKEIKAPALERCKQIDEEAKRITAELVALEKPIDEQIKAEEDRKAEIRRQNEEAEQFRLHTIKERITVISGLHLKLVNLPNSLSMREIIQTVREQVTATEAEFQEWQPIAQMAIDETLRQMEIIVADKEAAEIEECRKAEEYAMEQKRLADEQDLLRIERELFEKQQREAKEQQDRLDAERKERQEREDAERKERQDKEDAERREAQEKIEDDRRKVEQAAQEQRDKEETERRKQEEEKAESDRLQREKEDKEQEEIRKTQEEARRVEFEMAMKAPYAALEKIREIAENKDLSVVALRNQIIAVCDIAMSGK